jgi:processive 1,2-diacylglycerol beta-glucosyltransferase
MMRDKPIKIIILSEDVAGHGHRKAAEALVDGIRTVELNSEVSIYNVFPLVSRTLEKCTSIVYRQVVSNIPSVWGWTYEQEKSEWISKPFKKILTHLVAVKLIPFLREQKPDVIVCTHAFSLGALAHLKGKGFSFQLGVAITDMDVNSFWVYDAIDFYLVGNERMKDKLVKFYGVKESKVHVTGIPIHGRFSNVLEREKAYWKASLGLNPQKPVTLITGGGWGHGPMLEMVDAVRGGDTELQIIVVTGNNTTLKEHMERKMGQWPNLTRVYGYVKQMEELMGASDLLVAKPGGLTASEALALGIPLVCYKPIPGQEERNMRFLLETGAAVCAYDPKELREVVLSLLRQPGDLTQMGENCFRFGKPRSSAEAAKVILEHAKRS